MISLTPIHRKIQKRLFEKSQVLGRVADPNSPASGLNLNNLSSRSVFIRMTSGLERPVVINGGELIDGAQLAAGYDQLYSKDLHRPIPGIKSIKVGFLGGVRALREATIEWTCWSFDEIERLTPHFLSVGKTVLLEWGWVYDKKSLVNLPTFIKSNGQIKASAYTDYKNVVTSANGDFDMMVAICKNFQFTTRDDGGFDCQTVISGMGTSTIQNIEPHKSEQNTDVKTGLSENATAEESDDAAKKSQTPHVPMTLKTMINQLDIYVTQKAKFIREYDDKGKIKSSIRIKKEPKGFHKPIQLKRIGGLSDYAVYHPNQYIVQYTGPQGQVLTTINNVWVQWGWFEDNILSKFTSLVSDGTDPNKTTDDTAIAEFRSVEKYINVDGSESSLYEPTRIKNHPNFETIDLNRYIVPGKFKPFEKPTDSPEIIKGDDQYFHRLADIVNENFNDFSPSTTIEQSLSYDIQSGDNLNAIAKKFGVTAAELASSNNIKNPSKIAVGQTLTINSGKKTEVDARGKRDQNTGYLRHLLINTKVLREAFGVGDTDEFPMETTNVEDSIYQMFSILNQDINMWDFEIVIDETESYRSKIIDKSITIPLPTEKEKINSPFVKKSTSMSVYRAGELQHNGVFYFPTWAHNSIVKNQNISSTIPNSMAMSIMYGGNQNKLDTAGTPSSEVNTEADVTAALGKDKDNSDSKLKNISNVINKSKYETYGLATPIKKMEQYPLERLGIDTKGEDNLSNFFKSDGMNARLKADELKQSQVESEQAVQDSKATTIDDVIDPSVPPPLPDRLAIAGVDAFSTLGELKDGAEGVPNPLATLYSTKFNLEGENTGKMKSQFIDSISYNMEVGKPVSAGTPTTTETTKPLLLPLEMELTIDGIGGIYPGNSYHSTYLPKRYKEEALFQAFDVDHSVDSTGWSTTISGKMRSSVSRMTSVSTKVPVGKTLLSIQEQFKKLLAKNNLKLGTEKEVLGDGALGQKSVSPLL